MNCILKIKAVGERLALWAMNKAYGENLVCSGPLYKSHKHVEIKYKYFLIM